MKSLKFIAVFLFLLVLCISVLIISLFFSKGIIHGENHTSNTYYDTKEFAEHGVEKQFVTYSKEDGGVFFRGTIQSPSPYHIELGDLIFGFGNDEEDDKYTPYRNENSDGYRPLYQNFEVKSNYYCCKIGKDQFPEDLDPVLSDDCHMIRKEVIHIFQFRDEREAYEVMHGNDVRYRDYGLEPCKKNEIKLIDAYDIELVKSDVFMCTGKCMANDIQDFANNNPGMVGELRSLIPEKKTKKMTESEVTDQIEEDIVKGFDKISERCDKFQTNGVYYEDDLIDIDREKYTDYSGLSIVYLEYARNSFLEQLLTDFCTYSAFMDIKFSKTKSKKFFHMCVPDVRNLECFRVESFKTVSQGDVIPRK